MAQHDYDIANQTFPATRSDINDALAAIVSNNSGATAPATTFAYMFWADTTGGLMRQRNAANSAWITIGTLSSTNYGLAPISSPTFTGTPAAPTAAADTNTTQLATTAFVLAQSASQSEVEAITSITKFASPRTMQYHPGVAKAWVRYGYSAGVPTAVASHNVASITDNGTGDALITLTTAFSSANFCAVGSVEDQGWTCSTRANSASVIRVRTANTSFALADAVGQINVVAFGDQ